MKTSLLNFIILAIIVFAGDAGEAHRGSGSGATRRPDWRAADHTRCTILLCCKHFAERRNELFSIRVLFIFNDSICKFFNRNVSEHLNPALFFLMLYYTALKTHCKGKDSGLGLAD